MIDQLSEDSIKLLAQRFFNIGITIDGNVLQETYYPNPDDLSSRQFIEKKDGHQFIFLFSLHEENELILTQLSIFTVISALLFIIAIVFYRHVLNKSLQPLLSLNNQVSNLTAETIDKKINVEKAPYEVKQLEQSIQMMQDRLKQSFENEYAIQQTLKQFVSDASHELKTPLTSIQGFTEVLLRSDLKDRETVAKSIVQIHEQAKRMTKLTEHLLQLTKAERAEPLQLETLSWDELLDDLRPVLNMLDAEHTITYKMQAKEPLQLDVIKIQQVVLNLIQNAIRYSPPHTEIMIQTNGRTLEVIDEGEGIAPEHVPHIFERFYRVDKHRARQTGGEGLGLAITKAIVEQHGGKIQVTSEVGVGTCFKITM